KEAGIQLKAEQADWKDDTDDESDDQELEAHYMYMAKIQEVSPDAIDSGPIFDTEPEQKVQNDDHYDVFAIECQHPEQSESVHKTYLIEQDEHNVIIESVNMNYDSESIDQNDEDVDLAKEHTISILSKEKEAQIKLYKTQEDKELEKDIELENKVKRCKRGVVRTDIGTEFLNQTLRAYFAAEGIQHQTLVARTPEQNGVVERRNRTLVEAARTMLSADKVPLFFWAKAIATACFTQNRSLLIPRHEKTPYHIINDRKPDEENLDKMKEKGDECIFMGYSTQSRAYRVFNKRTRVIMESIHVNFDELPQMALDQNSSDPAPECQTVALEHDSLIPGPIDLPQTEHAPIYQTALKLPDTSSDNPRRTQKIFGFKIL
nr:hypothetical protein [Tanacetum cinerariifolium]